MAACLAQLLTPFRLGLGGPLGNGRQYMSWISISDEVGAIEHALADRSAVGPVNLVAPRPVTNREFAQDARTGAAPPARVAHAAHAAADGVRQRVRRGGAARRAPAPCHRELLASGYRFEHDELEAALAGSAAPLSWCGASNFGPVGLPP